MNVTDTIIEYLLEKYQPDGLITYGSFADESANETSDFDALVIAGHVKAHDSSVVGGTVLDVFVYPPETTRRNSCRYLTGRSSWTGTEPRDS